MTDAQLYHQILGDMVEDLTRKVAGHVEEAERLLALTAPDGRHSPEEAARMVGYRTTKAEEHREEAAILRRRIEALKAGMESLTW